MSIKAYIKNNESWLSKIDYEVREYGIYDKKTGEMLVSVPYKIDLSDFQKQEDPQVVEKEVEDEENLEEKKEESKPKSKPATTPKRGRGK